LKPSDPSHTNGTDKPSSSRANVAGAFGPAEHGDSDTHALIYVYRDAGFGAACNDIQQFRARVLVINAQGSSMKSSGDGTSFSPPVSTRANRVFRRSQPRDGRLGSQWSALGDYAAASVDRHVPHAADRFTSTRRCRATAACSVRSAGTASPVAKYISSGVWPRNAECGSTWLCC
jgi:hypothetical protein